MPNQLYITEDGCHSILSEKFGVLYHSKHGSYNEGQHVFVISGLQKYLNSNINREINILEIGLGSYLNLLLTIQFQQQYSENLIIMYQGIEAYPIEDTTFASLNYCNFIAVSPQLFDSIHYSPWNRWNTLIQIPNFHYFKKLDKFENIDEISQFDIIYFDAFAPNIQAELWETPMLSQIAISMKPNAILVSYCSKGSFRRALQSVGLLVEKIPGPPGKREMLRATKPSNII